VQDSTGWGGNLPELSLPARETGRSAIAGGLKSGSSPPNQWILNGTGSINPDEGQHEANFPGDTIISCLWDLNNNGNHGDDGANSGSTLNVTSQFAGMVGQSFFVTLKVTCQTSVSFPSSGCPASSRFSTSRTVRRPDAWVSRSPSVCAATWR
jgi:hypothetical protein